MKGDGAMATASKHVRKLLDGLANQAETAPLTHKVRDFTRLVATSINHTLKESLQQKSYNQSQHNSLSSEKFLLLLKFKPKF